MVSEYTHAHEVWRPLATHGKGAKFRLRGKKSCLKMFNDVCVSECQGTWCNYDALTDEAREEVKYNKR